MNESGKIRILNVDDTRDSLRIKSFVLQQAGFEVVESMTGTEALRLVAEKMPQVVLLDVNLPDISGFEVCRQIKANPLTASTLILQISACYVEGSDRTRGLEEGADGYLTSPVEPPLLIATIKSLLRIKDTAPAIQPVPDAQMDEGGSSSDITQTVDGWMEKGELGSCSPEMHRILEMLPRLAASTATVLIKGETGTGKELLARTIHQISPKANEPFIAINCCALPEHLLESELFGYKAGAFTGALKDKPGRFALAQNGTIFLDEIGDVSLGIQVKLLRVLQEKTFEPLGSLQPEKSTARIIVATNRSLSALIEQGTFRADLFYRINVVSLELPPLRNRKEDISHLIDQMIAKFKREHAKDIAGVSDEVMACLMAHDFPGNIRELENILEHAYVLCRGNRIEVHHLPENLFNASQASLRENPTKADLKSMETKAILEGLKRNQYNRLATARELGIHKSTLFRKLKDLDFQLPPRSGRSKKK